MKNILYEILLGNQIKYNVFENFLAIEIFQLSQNSRTKISFENRRSKKGTFPLTISRSIVDKFFPKVPSFLDSHQTQKKKRNAEP
jgi:hypothetical protein